MTKIYSYVLTYDNGAAPNPFWDCCTLAICKPAIRRTAQVGNWIIGTGSKNAAIAENQIKDYSNKLVYAMKVTQKMTFQEYDQYCETNLQQKRPNWNSDIWQEKLGDCLFDYSGGHPYKKRKGVHKTSDLLDRDQKGIYVLLSDHYYYFGEQAINIPEEFHGMIKKGPGHKLIENQELVSRFIDWMKKFQKNHLYGDPQRKWLFEGRDTEYCPTCAGEVEETAADEVEEKVC